MAEINIFEGWYERPPIGVPPKHIWKAQRLGELLRAAHEAYQYSGLSANIVEWLDEAAILADDIGRSES